jgi:hypothetical protein
MLWDSLRRLLWLTGLFVLLAFTARVLSQEATSTPKAAIVQKRIAI